MTFCHGVVRLVDAELVNDVDEEVRDPPMFLHVLMYLRSFCFTPV